MCEGLNMVSGNKDREEEDEGEEEAALGLMDHWLKLFKTTRADEIWQFKKMTWFTFHLEGFQTLFWGTDKLW